MTSKAFQPNSKELDHILPRGVGGTHTHGNVRIICRSCNLKRPKDGRDFFGQLTLWAAAPGVSVRVKPKAAPKPGRVLAICSCGNEFRSRNGSGRCHACIVEIAVRAARLRRQGWTWGMICTELGYSNTGGLYLLVQRYGASADAAA
jgi:hypothetical protein